MMDTKWSEYKRLTLNWHLKLKSISNSIFSKKYGQNQIRFFRKEDKVSYITVMGFPCSIFDNQILKILSFY